MCSGARSGLPGGAWTETTSPPRSASSALTPRPATARRAPARTPRARPPAGRRPPATRPRRPRSAVPGLRSSTAAAKGAVSASPARNTLPVHDSVAGSAGGEHAPEGGAARQGELVRGAGQDLGGVGLAGAGLLGHVAAKPAIARVGGSARLISSGSWSRGPNRCAAAAASASEPAAAVVVAQRQVEPGAADREAAARVAQQRPGAVDLGPAAGRSRPWRRCRCRRPRSRRGARRAPPGARSPRRWRWPRGRAQALAQRRRRSGRRSGSAAISKPDRPSPTAAGVPSSGPSSPTASSTAPATVSGPTPAESIRRTPGATPTRGPPSSATGVEGGPHLRLAGVDGQRRAGHFTPFSWQAFA